MSRINAPAFSPAGGATGAPSSTSPGACGFPPRADFGAWLVEKTALPVHRPTDSELGYGDWKRHDDRADADELNGDE